MIKRIWLFWLSFGVTIAILIGLFCFHKVARTVPINYILLFTYTLFESYMVASISIFYPPESIAIAAVLTFSIFIGLTVFAFFVNFQPLSLNIANRQNWI